ncbi:MAG: 1-deoxy-D-xylulose-5-phosphate reductoisomerase [Synergistaceae bacterium]|nr:1-deoxy-D-xylulose-5-phosphate reductoisomerase [Synergistaceae bacterium]
MYNSKISLVVFGATGSVGTSVLDICEKFPDVFSVYALVAQKNEEKLVALGRKFGAKVLCLTTPSNGKFSCDGFVTLTGQKAADEIVEMPEINHAVFASSGTDSIIALQKALSRGIDVSLANKESIVVAGPWVMPLVKYSTQLRPVDSEHSAVWQCIRNEPKEEILRVYLTASGGPFRDYTLEQMQNVTPKQALAHPVWSMGPKITIDSATLMNKGIECIEAMRLFDLSSEQVAGVIHPKSHIHGMAKFCDGTYKLMISTPDMRLPSAAAMAYPKRLPVYKTDLTPLPVSDFNLVLTEIDEARFPCYKLARQAGEMGGAYPSLLIGADEVAVNAFLEEKIKFLEISSLIDKVFANYKGSAPNTLEDAIALVETGKILAQEAINS